LLTGVTLEGGVGLVVGVGAVGVLPSRWRTPDPVPQVDSSSSSPAVFLGSASERMSLTRLLYRPLSSVLIVAMIPVCSSG
jgi:hypothetical protein